MQLYIIVPTNNNKNYTIIFYWTEKDRKIVECD